MVDVNKWDTREKERVTLSSWEPISAEPFRHFTHRWAVFVSLGSQMQTDVVLIITV